MATENKLADLSMEFSVSILTLCNTIKGHYSLVNQLERSATSIGANIREAKYAHGRDRPLGGFLFSPHNGSTFVYRWEG